MAAAGVLVHGNIEVQAFDAVGPYRMLGSTRTNAFGDYTLALPGPATVKLTFLSPDAGPAYAQRWWNDKPYYAQADPIVVNGNVTNINEALDAGFRISGRVTDATLPGVGVPNVNVTAQPNFSCCFYSASTDLAVVVRALDDASVEVAGLGLAEPTLDDVYLTLAHQPAAA